MELENIKTIIETKVNELGFDLYSLKLRRDGQTNVLEIVIDRKEAIDLSTIVEVTNALSTYLDEVDPIKDPYTLDISSLGVEKPLKLEKLKEYESSYIHVHLINPIDGENIYEGVMNEVSDESFKLTYRIKTREKTILIQKSNVSQIRLAIKF